MVSTLSPSFQLILARHGETAWSKSGQHTGHTDIPLTEHGMEQARILGLSLHAAFPALQAVYSSPLNRALTTCKTASYEHPRILEDAMEWNYGAFEGKTAAQIRKRIPHWNIWDNGVELGETISDVAHRAARVLDLICDGPTPAILFSHGHFLRILAALWTSQEPDFGKHLSLDPAHISTLGIDRSMHSILNWNLNSHL